ncbi:MAG TPA: DUF4124 domain-containing protein [Steroidobacteraceae bacterium]|jgi:hypothetical protein
MRRILFTLMLLGCSVALATTIVYKWVDEYGVIHYSDQPHPNAERLEVQGVQTYSARAAAPVRGPSEFAPRPAPSGSNPYKGCVIAQPVDQQNLENVASIMVRVASEPMPRAEDRVFITLDGQAVNGGQPTGLSFNVASIDRGEHSVSAQIRGPGDEVLCRTTPVNFFVQQHNLLSPAATGQPGVSPRPH